MVCGSEEPLWLPMLSIARELIQDSRELPGGGISTPHGAVNFPESISSRDEFRMS
jgi:hypothetical protein